MPVISLKLFQCWWLLEDAVAFPSYTGCAFSPAPVCLHLAFVWPHSRQIQGRKLNQQKEVKLGVFFCLLAPWPGLLWGQTAALAGPRRSAGAYGWREGNEKASPIQGRLLPNFLRGNSKLHSCRGTQESRHVDLGFGAKSPTSQESALNMGLWK